MAWNRVEGHPLLLFLLLQLLLSSRLVSLPRSSVTPLLNHSTVTTKPGMPNETNERSNALSTTQP
jgi:hypothetical protein